MQWSETNGDDRLLPHQIRKPRLTKEETKPQTLAEREALQTKGEEFRLVSKNRKPHVFFGHLPVCQDYKSELDAHMEECFFRHVESEEKATKKSNNDGAKGSVYTIGFVYLKILVRWEFGSEHAVKFSKGTWHPIKTREKKAPASKSSEARNRSRFKSINAHDEQKNFSSDDWILGEGLGTPLWCLQPMAKCIQTKKHRYTFTI